MGQSLGSHENYCTFVCFAPNVFAFCSLLFCLTRSVYLGLLLNVLIPLPLLFDQGRDAGVRQAHGHNSAPGGGQNTESVTMWVR